MKKTALFLLLSSLSSFGAITIGGTAVTAARNAAGTASVSTGSLALLIVDTDNNGFFNFGNSVPLNTGYNSTFDPIINTTNAGIQIGSTFGGELVLNRISTGTGSIAGLLTNVNVSAYLNRAFAVVWFSNVTSSGTSDTTNGANAVAVAGSTWGVVRGADWVFPAADSGTFSHNSSNFAAADVYAQVSANSNTTGQFVFRTTNTDGTAGASSFTIVPETSTSLLGAIGALALLRRRRN